MAKWWYNTCDHSPINKSPFEALYGYSPTHLPLGPCANTIFPVATQVVQDKQQMIQTMRDLILKAQHRRKFFTDQHRTEVISRRLGFSQVSTHKQQSVAIRKSLKLTFKYFGP
ncbi:hypothetical protein ACH5RR_037211 [Cinchona calisaya]|uniref:Uncharacterized protein n=1 Tax=Cinchona calisaya TaxID=153742 RepID=A0ABD2Y8L5_9GENT